MRYFIDTEFDQETRNEVRLVSLGIACEDGRELYATTRVRNLNPWLQKNVVPHLNNPMSCSETYCVLNARRSVIRQRVVDFTLRGIAAVDQSIEFWGYYADYDWFLFTRLWGFMDMPNRFPLICYDVKQLATHKGIPSVSNLLRPYQPEHHALVDARWTRDAWKAVMAYKRPSQRDLRSRG